jgi:hypothetical protein
MTVPSLHRELREVSATVQAIQPGYNGSLR